MDAKFTRFSVEPEFRVREKQSVNSSQYCGCNKSDVEATQISRELTIQSSAFEASRFGRPGIGLETSLNGEFGLDCAERGYFIAQKYGEPLWSDAVVTDIEYLPDDTVRIEWTYTLVGFEFAEDVIADSVRLVGNQNGGLSISFQHADGDTEGFQSANFEDGYLITGFEFLDQCGATDNYIIEDYGSYKTYRYFFTYVTIGGVTYDLRNGVPVTGTNADERLYGFDVNDYTGEVFHDTIKGLGGNDTIIAYSGNDEMDGGDGNDSLNGGDGNDRFIGSPGQDQNTGGAGNDRYIFDIADNGEYVYEEIDGGNDIIRIRGDVTADDFVFYLHFFGNTTRELRMYLKDDPSTFYIHANARPIDIDGESYSDLFLRLEKIIFDDGSEIDFSGGLTITGFDNPDGEQDLFGTQFDDVFTPVAGDQVMNGLAGDDVINGGDGRDYLNGGDGDDVIYGSPGQDNDRGQAGNDTFIISPGNQSEYIYEEIDDGFETIWITGGLTADDFTFFLYFFGSSTRDLRMSLKDDPSSLTIVVDAYATEIDGISYSDLFRRVERIIFDDGSEIDLTGGLTIVGIEGSDHNLYGTQFDDIIKPVSGDQSMLGYAGDDDLNGGQGTDRLNGGDGDDILRGSLGQDHNTGGAGDDRYFVRFGDQSEYIYEDANGGYDILRITGGLTADDFNLYFSFFSSYSRDLILSHKNTSSDLYISFEGGAVDIDGVSYADIFQRFERIVFDDGSEIDLTGGLTIVGVEGSDQTLYGTQFDDVIKPVSGDQSMLGYAGDDDLNGGIGTDRLYGGDGNDKLRSSAGTDHSTGGAGDDRYFAKSGDQTEFFYEDVNGGQDTIRITGGLTADDFNLFFNFSGSTSSDLIFSLKNTPSELYIILDGGVVNIHGANYSDVFQRYERILFDDGTEIDLTGGLTIVGVDGSTQNLYGTQFDDVFKPVLGNQSMLGQAGDDILDGGEGNDRLHGGADNDILLGSAGSDINYGNEGNDSYFVSAGNAFEEVTEYANEGSDTLYVTGGLTADDLNIYFNFWGSYDRDLILIHKDDPSTLQVTISGSSIDINGVNYSDIFQRFERVVFDDGSEIDLTTGLTISGVDGSTAALYGTQFGDVFTTVEGSQSFLGRAGDDIISGGSGNDYISGGEGVDTANYEDAPSGILANLSSSVYVTANPELANISARTVQDGYGNVDQIDSIENVVGSQHDDVMIGDDTNNLLVGMHGRDILEGGAGDDHLIGGGLRDTLNGGLGTDTYEGGEGNDLFVINSGEADGDFVADFEARERLITNYQSFIGTQEFTDGGASQLRYFFYADETIFEADVNGDGIADETFTIDGLWTFSGTPDYLIGDPAYLPHRDFDFSGTSDLLFQLPSKGNIFRLDDPATGATASNEGRPGSTSLGLTDLDGDGTLDHVMVAASGAHVVQYAAENSTSDNIGRGKHTVFGFADVDGDGSSEAFAQSFNPNNTALYILDDQFATLIRLPISDQTLKGFGDFDGDGVTDALIEASNGAKRIYSDADGMVLYGKRNNDTVAIGDFDGDGDADLLTTRGGGNPFYILEGDETSPFDTETSIGFGFHTAVAAGDFDGDGAKDILIRENATENWSLLTSGLTSQSVLNLAAFEYEAVGDFNGDGEDDILFRLGNDNGRIYYSGDLSTFDTLTDMSGQNIRDIADYNGDGLDDILISDRTTGAFSILSSGTGAPVALDSGLDGASVVAANGIDTLGLLGTLPAISEAGIAELRTDTSSLADGAHNTAAADIFIDGWV